MKNQINKLIQSLGKPGYNVDKSLYTSDLIIVLLGRMLQLLRGFSIKIFLKKSSGLVFIGKHSKIKFKKHLSIGKTIIIGNNVEINALSKSGITIGNNVTILSNTIIECTGNIKNLGEELIIGNNVGIAQNCFIQVRGKVSIDDYVIFGPYVKIFSENHNFSNLERPIVLQGETRLPVTIEKNVWVGSNATILGGVTIGEGSIVAAGAVVNKSFPPNSIIAGIPAKIVKMRK